MGRYKISRLFNEKALSGIAALTLTGILSGCGTITTNNSNYDNGTMRLTEGEKALSENFFGAANINTSIVRKRLSEEHHKKAAAVTIGKDKIIFYKKYHSDDYSDRTDTYKLALFAHEMTHIWQHQNWSDAKQKAKRCHNYDYKLSPDDRFEDFCNEQQASIIQDYSHYFLTANPVFPLRLQNTDKNSGLSILQKLVETTFPGSKKERFKVETLYPDVVILRILRAPKHTEAPLITKASLNIKSTP